MEKSRNRCSVAILFLLSHETRNIVPVLLPPVMAKVIYSYINVLAFWHMDGSES